MFDIERFVADCRKALKERSPQSAIREIVARTMSNPGEVEKALGTPHEAKLVTLHQAPDLTILNGGDFFGVPRSEFDPDTLEERPYDAEKAKQLFREAN
jgi:hypothetical protein